MPATGIPPSRMRLDTFAYAPVLVFETDDREVRQSRTDVCFQLHKVRRTGGHQPMDDIIIECFLIVLFLPFGLYTVMPRRSDSRSRPARSWCGGVRARPYGADPGPSPRPADAGRRPRTRMGRPCSGRTIRRRSSRFVPVVAQDDHAFVERFREPRRTTAVADRPKRPRSFIAARMRCHWV